MEAPFVRGNAPLNISVQSRDPESQQQVCILIDGEAVSLALEEPHLGVFDLDTAQLEDGQHRLSVLALQRESGVSVRTIHFTTSNWWQLVDHLESPLLGLWFGVIERLKATQKSERWKHVGDSPEAFFDDDERMVREAPAREFLIWRAPALTDADITLYVKDTVWHRGVSLAVAGSSENWKEVTYVPILVDTSHDGWQHIKMQVHLDADPEVQRFRLTLTEDVPAEAVHLGAVMLKGCRLE